MGTPDFALPSLTALLEAGEEVISVYTQPDRPKGRGRKSAPSPVKERALSYHLPVFQPVSLKERYRSGPTGRTKTGFIDCCRLWTDPSADGSQYPNLGGH